MKIIICGAGQVGHGIAERLSGEDHDVTVIDTKAPLIRSITDSLDVQGIIGHGSHPDILEQAGAPEADMIIAATYIDEVNMMACEVSNAFFSIPTKIARVRHQSYLKPEYSHLFAKEHTAIDVVISPEIAVGDMVLRRLALPGAIESISFGDEQIIALGIHLNEDCPVLDTPLVQLTELFPDLDAVIVGIYRQGKLFIPHGQDMLEADDEIYVVAAREQAGRTLGLFGHEEQPAKRIVIAGGGNIGLYVAEKLEQTNSGTNVTLIEANRSRAEYVSEKLRRAMVLNGSALSQPLLHEAAIQQSESFLALTNDDKVNILASMLAKQEGAGQVMTLVSARESGLLASPLGIDSFIDPRSITISSILQHVRRGRIRGVHPVKSGAGEFVEAEVLETSPIVGKDLQDILLPHGVRFGIVQRGETLLRPHGEFQLKANDRIVMFALRDTIKEIQQLFRVSLEYF